jgi:beta-lactamase regulating signal transducer with metallopeptidase domain
MNPDLIAPEAIQRLAGSLLHFIWQGAAIALITATGLRMLRHRCAEARYALAIGSLACMLAAPLFTVVFYTETGAVARRLILTLNPASEEGRSAATAFQASVWAQRILLAWFAGVLVFATRMVVGWRLSWKLVKSAEQILAPGVLEIFDNVRDRLGLRGPVRLMAHLRLDSPVVVGWLRPVVLLPVYLISGFTPEQLSAILAHELAHIRRHDFVVNVLQRAVESILFYHPAVWWLSKRIRAEREHCCDDIAIRLCGSRKVYAEVLIAMERARQPRPGLSVAAADGVVLQRFRRVLGMSTFAVDWQSAVGTLLFLGVWAVVGMWQSASTLQAKPAVAVQTSTEVKSVPAPPAILTTVSAPAAAVETVNAIAAILTAQPVIQVPADPQPEPLNFQAFIQAMGLTSVRLQKPPDCPRTPSETASVEGLLVRAGTQEPVPGATVELTRIDGSPCAPIAPPLARALAELVTPYGGPGPGPDEGISETKSVISSNGAFAFRGLKEGRYRLVAVDPTGTYLPVQYGQRTPRDVALLFQVSQGQNIRDIRLEAIPTAAIEGRVTDENGDPIARARVMSMYPQYVNGQRVLLAEEFVRTDDKGFYRLYWLPPGPRYVAAAVEDPDRRKEPVGFVPGGFVGTQMPTYVMRQVLPDGEVKEEVWRTVYYGGSTSPATAQALDLQPGQTLSGINISMAAARTRARHIRGILLDATGQRMAGAEVRAVPRDWGPAAFLMPAATTTRSDGTFDIGDVMPGAYTLFGFSAKPPLWGERVVEVVNEDLNNVSLVASPPFDVQVRVTVDGAAARSTSRVSVDIQRDDYWGAASAPRQPRSSGLVSPMDDKGQLTIQAFPGSFQVNVLKPGNSYVKRIRMGETDILNSGLHLSRQPDDPLEIEVATDSASLEGVVAADTLAGIPNAVVVLIPAPTGKGLRSGLIPSRRLGTQNARTDSEGRFRLTTIPPGEYLLFAWDSIEMESWEDPAVLKPFESSAVRVILAPHGEQKGLRVTPMLAGSGR